jgi:hypothetical protein
VSFQSLILAFPDVAQKQWAAWLGCSTGAVYHWAQGHSSPPIDDCVRAFASFPPEIQDRFLAMFPRGAEPDADPQLDTPIMIASRCLRLGLQLHDRVCEFCFDPFVAAEDVLAIKIANQRTLDTLAVAVTKAAGGKRPTSSFSRRGLAAPTVEGRVR